MHVGLFKTQDNLPSNRDSIEEVVDEAHVVDEGVHVAGTEHEQGGQALRNRTIKGIRDRKFGSRSAAPGLFGGDMQYDGANIKKSSDERRTHSEEQSRDGSAAFHMDHGQQTGQVALSGSSKEQSAKMQ